MSLIRSRTDVHVAAAQEPLLDADAQMGFAVHRDPQVRAAIAARSDAPLGALVSLGYDPKPAVLEALIENPRTPPSVVRKLSDHRTPAIAEAAGRRLRHSHH